MVDDLKNLKIHLKNQIKRSEQLDSNWVYILRSEAKKCLELAEAEETKPSDTKFSNNVMEGTP